MQNLMVTPIIGTILANFVTVNLFKKSISKVFGPDTKPSDEEVSELFCLTKCNGGFQLFTENIHYMTERKQHKERWEQALLEYASSSNNPFVLIDGPADPVSGRHLGEYAEQQGLKVVFLDAKVGHWPQLEAPDETMACFFAFHKDIGTVPSETCNDLNVKLPVTKR
jgi:pimeloyl-ACP methyl ester carboxylesterase